jgi:hypothetical protein
MSTSCSEIEKQAKIKNVNRIKCDTRLKKLMAAINTKRY